MRDRFESTSNISTAISNRSDAEKKRELEVLEKIQKIWTEMAVV